MRPAVLAAAAACLSAGLLLAQADPFGFVPDGGRGAFAAVFPDPDSQSWALGQTLDAAAWVEEITRRAPDLGAVPTQTLAAWLAAVAPRNLADGEPLPADGRDLALAQCQSCHGLFSGYLMHRRSREGWLAIFASPFHSGLAMTESERSIFADYSTLNMPLRIEDVPPEFRF